jgi:hypothetical protein
MSPVLGSGEALVRIRAAPPMALGNMRANGVRTLGVWCSGRGCACGAGIYHPKPRVMLIN